MSKPKRRDVKTFTKRGIFSFLLLFFACSAYANTLQPALIDYKIAGNEQAPYFIPEVLNLHVGTPYLLVIDNPFDNNINFIYDKLGQVTYTHYLQGVSGASQSSMSIPAQSKITWLLEINQPGEFFIYAMNMGSGQRGPASKLIVKTRHQNQKNSNLSVFPEEALLLPEIPNSQENEIRTENKVESPKRPRLGGRKD